MTTAHSSHDSGAPKRVTISDIAERVGVTAGAVSMAINGKPGVSDATRERILRVADELNWRPSHVARSLMGGDSESIGLVLARPTEVIGEEVFFSKFLAGVQTVLSEHDYALLLKTATTVQGEIDIYRAWVAQGRVDAILVIDPRVADPRISALVDLGTPALVVGGTIDQGRIRSLHTDNTGGMRRLLEHLAGLGHERIAFVTGDLEFRHTQERVAAFNDFCIDEGIAGQCLSADFDPERAKTATQRLLRSPKRPTAIVYDSDVMAIAGFSALSEAGIQVPKEMSIASWEDSSTCRVLHPTITAINRDALDLGRHAASAVLDLVQGRDAAGDGLETRVIARESTAHPPKTTRRS